MKNEKRLRNSVEKSQSPQEIVRQLVNEKKLSREFLAEMVKTARSFEGINFFSSQKYLMPKVIRPGMFDYADGFICEKLLAGEPIRSIIGYASDERILGWCLKSKKCSWSDDYFASGTGSKTLRGFDATTKIVVLSKKCKKKARAAEFAYRYAIDGVTKETAFIPSDKEGHLLLSGVRAVNSSLIKAGLEELEEKIWLATEFDLKRARTLCPYEGKLHGLVCFDDKSDEEIYARPVIELRLQT